MLLFNLPSWCDHNLYSHVYLSFLSYVALIAFLWKKNPYIINESDVSPSSQIYLAWIALEQPKRFPLLVFEKQILALVMRFEATENKKYDVGQGEREVNNLTGNILRADMDGYTQMRTYLSGKCRFGPWFLDIVTNKNVPNPFVRQFLTRFSSAVRNRYMVLYLYM